MEMKMLKISVVRSLTLLGIGLFFCIPQASEAADVADGRAAYDKTCKRCHGPLEISKSSLKALLKPVVMLPLGPNLHDVFGRPAGINKGFQYSKAMKAFAKAGAVWDRDTLDLFLSDSTKLVPGSFMFIQLSEPQRSAVIDYLEEVARHQP